MPRRKLYHSIKPRSLGMTKQAHLDICPTQQPQAIPSTVERFIPYPPLFVIPSGKRRSE